MLLLYHLTLAMTFHFLTWTSEQYNSTARFQLSFFLCSTKGLTLKGRSLQRLSAFLEKKARKKRDEKANNKIIRTQGLDKPKWLIEYEE